MALLEDDPLVVEDGEGMSSRESCGKVAEPAYMPRVAPLLYPNRGLQLNSGAA